jgi:prepilin-type N-terminal cleavage/methylation domain-containing protein
LGRKAEDMRTTRRCGFTLIELMIVIAVTLILLGAVFTVNFRISGLWSGERARSELQQNFRFATDTITNRVREAVVVLQPSADPIGESLGVNVMSDILQFDCVPDSSVPSQRQRVTYYRSPASASGSSHIVERIQTLQRSGSAPDYMWTPLGTPSERPITEAINSLAATHFVRTGPKIVVVLVAQYRLLGEVKTISYTTQTYVRAQDPTTS